MSVERRLGALLARITYKKGWDFSVSAIYGSDGQASPRTLVLSVTHPEPDVSNPGATARIAITRCLDTEEVNSLSDKQFVDLVFKVVSEAELHEVKEWFKFNGKCFENPHPGDFYPMPEMPYSIRDLMADAAERKLLVKR
jgi:hypothetical protein